MTWSTDELAKIAATDDLHVSPLRDDPRTASDAPPASATRFLPSARQLDW
jgi:hypothetical protein